jgi:hypothetical protein
MLIGQGFSDRYLNDDEALSIVSQALATLPVDGTRVHILIPLGTGIPEERGRIINPGYHNPATVNLKGWENHQDEGILGVPRAGEILYRLKESDHGI